MKLTTRLAAGALMATIVAVPATAEAKPVSKVRTQVVAADKSLDRVVSLVRQNRDNAASKELRKYRRYSRKAEGQVRGLRRGATGSVAGAKSYGGAVRLVGVVSNDCVDTLTKVVDEAQGNPQEAIARAISACIVTREKVVETLTALLDEVPAQARPYLAKVITILSTDGQDDVELITGVLGNTALPTDVAAILTQALELATGAINDAVGRLQGIVGMLPAAAQPMVQAALTLVTDSLQMVTTLVGDLLRGLFGGVPTTPGTGSPGGAPGGILGGGLPGLNVLQGMFGNGFPLSLVPVNLPVSIPGFGFAVR